MFGWSGFPANSDIAGLTTLRGLLDKNNLRCTGWHGSMTEADWPARVNAARILGCDSLGSGGFPNPGVGTYDNTLRTAETVTRLGKYAIEAGVGPVYWHNHRSEFQNRFMDNGVRKTSWQILMERIDPRYGFAEIDAGWASDAYDDVTGTKVAGLINQFPNSVKLLHIKDLAANIIPANPPASAIRSTAPRPALRSRSAPARSTTARSSRRPSTGSRTTTGSRTAARSTTWPSRSPTSRASTGTSRAPSRSFRPRRSRPSPPAPPRPTTSQAITVKNSGDAPLTISAAALQTGGNARADEAPGDFAVVSNTCVGTGVTIAPNATCVVNVGFKPTVTNKTSVARVRLTSTGDDAVESFYVVGKSTGSSLGGIGGAVDSVLALTLGSAPSFGSFAPATARNYDTAMSASVVSTAGNAILSVTDPSSTGTGKLVNGEFSLAQPLQVRANNAANTGTAFMPLSTTPGGAVALLLYTTPTAGADAVTIGFRQAIGANDVLRSGNYSKTLTFTVATTAP